MVGHARALIADCEETTHPGARNCFASDRTLPASGARNDGSEVVTKQRERFYVDPASAGDGPLLVRRKMNRPNPWPASARPGDTHELAATGLAAGGEYLAHSAMGHDTVSDKLDKLIAQMGGR